MQHNSLAFDPEGKQILGLAFQQLVKRKPQPEGETRDERARRAGKESRLWLEGIRGIGLAPAAARWIHVCDRGGDFFEAMQLVQEQDQEFLIRIHQDRRVSVTGVDEQTEEEREVIRSLHQTIRGITSATTRLVTVASRGGRPAREAKVQIGSRPAIVQPPRPDGARRGLRPLRVTLIRVWEEGVEEARAASASAKAAAKAAEKTAKVAEAAATAAEAAVAVAKEKEVWEKALAESAAAKAESVAAKAAVAAAKEKAKAATTQAATYLDWWLGTNGPIETVADVEQAVSDYEWRWPVAEEYHKVEKSGLKIESQRFESYEPLVAVLALMAVVAIRVLQLRYARDSQPEASAEAIATPEEIDMAGRATKRVGRVRSVKEFVDAVARLGGYLGRKGDGPPGWGTLWRGYQRLKDMLLGAELMQETAGSDPSDDEITPRDPPDGARDARGRPE